MTTTEEPASGWDNPAVTEAISKGIDIKASTGLTPNDRITGGHVAALRSEVRAVELYERYGDWRRLPTSGDDFINANMIQRVRAIQAERALAAQLELRKKSPDELVRTLEAEREALLAEVQRLDDNLTLVHGRQAQDQAQLEEDARVMEQLRAEIEALRRRVRELQEEGVDPEEVRRLRKEYADQREALQRQLDTAVHNVHNLDAELREAYSKLRQAEQDIAEITNRPAVDRTKDPEVLWLRSLVERMIDHHA